MDKLKIYEALNTISHSKLQLQFPYSVKFTKKTIDIEIAEHPGIFDAPPPEQKKGGIKVYMY